MPKLLFIVNPSSGKGQIKTHIINAADSYTKAGYDVTFRPTQGRMDAYEYIRAHAPEFDRIVVAGGDGTLNEAVNGLMEADERGRPKISYIPCGTTNDFASTLGIPKNIPKAIETAVSEKTIKCDVGCFNGKYFNYVAGFGAFTDVSYDTPQEVKNAIGHVAYVFEGIKRLASLPSYKVRIKYDGGEIEEEVFLCLILNATSIGGLLNTERLISTKLNDGVFEMLLFRQPANIGQLQQVISAIAMGDSSAEGCVAVHSGRFEVSCDEEIKWTLDGEFGGEMKNAVIEVVPSAVTYAIDIEGDVV